jgi:hypothetical protein
MLLLHAASTGLSMLSSPRLRQQQQRLVTKSTACHQKHGLSPKASVPQCYAPCRQEIDLAECCCKFCTNAAILQQQVEES